jgi:Uma2 family endonuclease
MQQAVITPPRTMLEAFKSFPEGTLVQLINNQLVMAAAPLDVHQLVLGEIHYELFGFVKKNKLGQTRVAPYDVFLSNKNVFQPDICFIANENLHKIQADGLHGAPDLVIELLSPSTSKYDLDEKKDVYERYGVKEYFIIEPATKNLDHYWLVNGEYEKQLATAGTINSQLLNCQIIF